MIDYTLRYTIPACYSLLPPAMCSQEATALLLAIGLHVSDFRARQHFHRVAVHSFWHFDRVGVREVLEQPRTRAAAEAVIDALCYQLPDASIPRQALEVFDAMTHNDVLACCWARLRLPDVLPGRDQVEDAWQQFVTIFKPGAYTKGTEDEQHQLRAKWTHNFAEAWGRVQAAPLA